MSSYHCPPRRRHAPWVVWGLWLLLASASAQAAPPPTVLVSIKPVHALASMVMQGIGAPELLIPAHASPHTYALRPSDARRLQQAQLLFWVGPGLESFLPRAMGGLTTGRAVAMTGLPGMTLLPLRSGGVWEEHGAHEEADPHGHAEHAEHAMQRSDTHLWLDPANARAMLEGMAQVLGEVDPERAGQYAANARAGVQSLAGLEAELNRELAGVKSRPFVVFHDAFQYFEHRFGLTALGSITLDPDHPPGARRLQELRTRIREQKAGCVFAEPQFRAALVETVVEGSPARAGTLDPYGLRHPPGAEAYAATLRELAHALRTCLEEK